MVHLVQSGEKGAMHLPGRLALFGFPEYRLETIVQAAQFTVDAAMEAQRPQITSYRARHFVTPIWRGRDRHSRRTERMPG